MNSRADLVAMLYRQLEEYALQAEANGNQPKAAHLRQIAQTFVRLAEDPCFGNDRTRLSPAAVREILGDA